MHVFLILQAILETTYPNLVIHPLKKLLRQYVSEESPKKNEDRTEVTRSFLRFLDLLDC